MVLAALALAGFAFLGGWLRRWMSDDGLIVLRTVRNLQAGNGPVFNVGERVEANTSTLWQYLIYLGSVLTPARLEIIAMWLALLLTTAAVAIAAIATARLYRPASLLFLPVGGLVYLALPPARDFATSGLEWGLSLFYLAVWWLLLVNWVRAGEDRHAKHDRVVYWLAFWAGLSWLVRPELALYGGLAGMWLLASARTPKVALGILAAALPVPAGYQIFRMGYYGLMTPHTAVAKSASDAQWASGWTYVRDLADPYWLFVALLIVAVMVGVLLWWQRSTPPVLVAAPEQHWRMWARSRRGIITLVVVAAALHLLYVIRVGGDFMHGRMLLLPLFAGLLPVMVMPILDLAAPTATPVPTGVLSVGVLAIGGWAWMVAYQGNPVDWYQEFEQDELTIVDEREFWTNATRRAPGQPPLVAEDFHKAKVLSPDWDSTVADIVEQDGAMMIPIAVSAEPEVYSWIIQPRQATESDLRNQDPTMYLINLGMTSMNAPLELRVLDTVGLATPVGARQPRDPDGRIGHDKALPRSWQVADTDAELNALPSWFDREEAILARAALRSPEISELMASHRAPLTVNRFMSNLGFALGPGRSLEISLDPRDHLTADQIEDIERYVEETEAAVEAGQTEDLPAPPGTVGTTIAW